MTLIRIQERSAGPNGADAILSFDYGAEYPITIHDPFSEEEEQRLEWYFEQWLRFPFLNQVKAQAAAQGIANYGERLFNQIFSDPEAYVAYRNAVQAGLSTVQIEIAGSPTFHRWHWEALKDPKLPQPLALQATMVRRNLKPQAVPAILRPSPTINLLVVTARPGGAEDVGYRTISRPLVEALRQADLPVQIDLVRPGTYRALLDHLEEVKSRQRERGELGNHYHVLHFDVHGALLSYEAYQQSLRQYQGEHILLEAPYGHTLLAPYEGKKAFLFLESEQEETAADPVEAGQLHDLLINYQIPIVILNACQSGKQVGTSETSLGSRLMEAGMQLVLAMGYSVTLSGAQVLMRILYQQLFAKQDLSTAIRRARQELYNRKERRAYFNQTIELEDWLLPVVYQNQEQRLAIREFTCEESKAYYEGLAQSYAPQQPNYGFVGRDLDILQIEKCLLTKRNIILVRGMGGAGKTTLLQHLGNWWQTTGLVEQVFYFAYDEKAWNREQILHSIAQRLLSPVEYLKNFQPLGLDAQQKMLTKQLRTQRHLVILDNLESITGQHLAIQHPLQPEEQDALRSFLVDISGGHTLVLLGSRSGENWLARETFEDNVYELGGLDPEAASTLADRILERHKATAYRQDKDLEKLLKLLAGFPLALEVVLSNLARKKPAEVLAALLAGDIEIDTPNSQKKTESIVRCIDYSHNNLSPQAQLLLLCLAPFTSVIYLDKLDNYTSHLKQQSALAKLPFERWPEVLQEAQNWGLLSPDSQNPGFLRLQPILPYYLHDRLSTSEQKEVQHAIQTAFREHYAQLGLSLHQLLTSQEPQEQQQGQVQVHLEYENLVTALKLALADRVSFLSLYGPLSKYLEINHDLDRGLELDQVVLDVLEGCPVNKLIVKGADEFIGVVSTNARRQLKLKQYAAAEASCQKALNLSSNLENVDEAYWSAGIYHQLGMIAEEQHQWTQAELYYQQALRIEIKLNDLDSQAHLYHQLGVVALQQRRWAQAELCTQQALQIKVQLNDLNDQASTYHLLGIVAQRQGKRKDAMQYYQQALQIFIKFNNLDGLVDTYHNLGMIAQELRQWEWAERYYQQALQISIDLKDLDWQARTYHNLGALARQQRQWTQAELYYQRALCIYNNSNDRYEQAYTYYELGRLAEEQRQWGQARDKFLCALELFVKYKDTYNSRIALNSLARLWQENDNTGIPAAVAPIMSMTTDEVKTLLKEGMDKEVDKSDS